MAKLTIIGGGPAGISAAIYSARAGIDTLVIYSSSGALEKTDKVENYFGFSEPVTGTELLSNGRAQARRLSAGLMQSEIVDIAWDSGFTLTHASGEKTVSDAVIIATGASRMAAPIKNAAAYEGAGLSYCAVCDGFFFKNKPVAVLGSGAYALHEASELRPLASSVTLLTMGKDPEFEVPEWLALEKTPPVSLEGDGRLEGILLSDGRVLKADGLFAALGSAGSTVLALKLGLSVSANSIDVDASMATAIPGLFAAGDCTAGMKQIAKAVYQGAEAASSAIKYLRSLKN